MSRSNKKLIVLLAVFFGLIVYGTASAAFVPCGGPGQHACTICDFFAMTQTVVKYAVFVLVPLLIALLTVSAGMYYMGSKGDAAATAKAKKWLLVGMCGAIILFGGWAFINTFFSAIGVADWNGVKLNESWWKVSATCALNEEASASCGDGILQADEECEPTMSVETCQGRYGWNEERCEQAIAGCSMDCKLPEIAGDADDGAPDDSGNDDVSDDDNTSYKDYCSDMVFDSGDYATRNQAALQKAAPEAAKATRVMPAGSANCSSACKSIGKTCIGIGSYDQMNCTFLFVSPPCCWKPSACKDDAGVDFGLCKPPHGGWEVGDCITSSARLIPFRNECEPEDTKCILNAGVVATVAQNSETLLTIAACIDEAEYKAVGQDCSKTTQVPIGSAFCYCL